MSSISLRRRIRFSGNVVALVALGASARAAPQDAAGDAFDLSVHSETHAALFRRALLPGPNGALVESDTVVPVNQYLRLEARDLDTSWQRDSIDVEVAGWGRAFIGEQETERPFDGDVQTAYARYTHGPIEVRLGRQHVAGGAARYARFDGATFDVFLPAGLDVRLYAGFTVLPRWNARPGYHHLGDAGDSLLRDPEALPEPDRAGNLLGGGRLGFANERLAGGLSFHEQHEDRGLSRRTLGADLRALLMPEVTAGGVALAELDAQRLQDGRLFLDTTPLEPLDVTLEYLHTEPALFLSRQSVLSVFSTDAYDEVGTLAEWRLGERISLDGGASIQIYDDEERGARGEIATRVFPGPGKRTRVRVGYVRVLAADNGYHSLRASLWRRILPELSGTLEAYSYLYDEPIRGRLSSEVYSGSLSHQATDALNVAWGASIAQSPYAAFDAQALVRLSYDFDYTTRGGRP